MRPLPQTLLLFGVVIGAFALWLLAMRLQWNFLANARRRGAKNEPIWISVAASVPPTGKAVLVRLESEDGEWFQVARRAKVSGLWATAHGARPFASAEVWCSSYGPFPPDEAKQITHWCEIPPTASCAATSPVSRPA